MKYRSRPRSCSSSGSRFPLIDKKIIPRLQHYAINNNIRDVDSAVSYLRANYREYKRHKEDIFRKSVQAAIGIVIQNIRQEDLEERQEISSPARKRPRIDPLEHRLLQREAAHIAKEINTGNSSSVQSLESSYDEEEVAEPRPFADLMNSLLRDNYGKSPNHNGTELPNPNNADVPNPEVPNLYSTPSDISDTIENGAVMSFKQKGEDENLDSVKGAPAPKGVNKEICVEKDGIFGTPRVLVSERSIVKRRVKVNGKGKVEEGGGEVQCKVYFKDLGGIDSVLKEIMDVIYPLYHPQIYPWLGVQPVKGVLLHGPPGCGKTKLAHAIATETGVPFYKISATEVVSGVSGESEGNIRALFDKASKTAPSIIFIDEIDAISAKRESLQREMERRIVTQLLTCMDGSLQVTKSTDEENDLETKRKKHPGHVLVIGATNRPDALDPALRRPGRFDREILLSIPDEKARLEILSVLTKGLRLEGSFDFKKVAKGTSGFVGADLASLTREAGSVAIKRILASRTSQNSLESESININVDNNHNINVEEWWRKPWTQEELDNLNITMADFEGAISKVQPSTRREGFSSIPNVKWEDVGALSALRKDFELYIIRRIKHPKLYEDLKMDFNDGFLLYGPPGCGKTLVAKAVANEAGANFIHIKGPELLNKYVGESELAVRTVFTRARISSPCIIFFDEIDALTTKRGKDGGLVVERLLTQLLIEMDGAENRKDVFLIGATNRPEVMDPAVLRPGRFGKLLYVPLPDASGRLSILSALTRKKPMAEDLNLSDVAYSEACKNFSGADLASLVNEACMVALQERDMTSPEANLDIRKNPLVLHFPHFDKALKQVRPSVSLEQKDHYEKVSRRLRSN